MQSPESEPDTIEHSLIDDSENSENKREIHPTIIVNEPTEPSPSKDESTESNSNSNKKLIIAIAIAIVVSIGIGIAGISYMENQAEISEIKADPFAITPEQLENSDVLELKIITMPPFASNKTQNDYMTDRLDHITPTVQQLQGALLWASNTDRNVLLQIEKDLLAGAQENNNSLSVGEKVLLEVITFSTFDELCDENLDTAGQCAFYDINLQEARYHNGDIDRDQYWLNVRQYASDEVIAQVEGNTDG